MTVKSIKIITEDRDYWKKLCAELSEREFGLETKVESLQVENGGLRELHERLEEMWLYEKRCLQEENARLSEVLEEVLETDEFEDIGDYVDRIVTKARQALRQSK